MAASIGALQLPMHKMDAFDAKTDLAIGRVMQQGIEAGIAEFPAQPVTVTVNFMAHVYRCHYYQSF
ncbi:hypothetical protein [Asticcacaulis sp. EMRT-3]|uniref:hypothetical protein n=1 Tax=Asticcacaulis sp. EMRT-3 TaxID=3040349 RepID=UPI0024AFEA4C|nr:hypothetical protein [Asticcacaulis sp. EMRT-3]MDI7774009.1 hypothetical protein [Asticcacaulis sp. EMRT-3]